jgi:hypothetical protein
MWYKSNNRTAVEQRSFNMLRALNGKLTRFLVITLVGFLASCATPYQPMGVLGGYREDQLAPDIYRVAFFGNGYTNGQTAAQYALHRCAELTQQKGYRYFGILAVTDMSTTRTVTIPGQAYTTGNLSVNSFGNTAYGTYHGTTFITPSRTIQFDFPRPVITIKMFNSWAKDANLVDASMILSVALPGLPPAPIPTAPSSSTYSGPRIDLDDRTKARIISFVQRFVASSESGSTLPPPISFYGPNVFFNDRPVSHEFIQTQFDTASRTFPQRSFQFLSGPTVAPSPDSTGATVNYELSGVLSNGLIGMHVKTAVQLTIQKRGQQFEIAAIWPRVLGIYPL